MSGQWKRSRRRDELPANWLELRKAVFKRDGWRCTAPTPAGRCRNIATDCDHVGDKGDHRMMNLTSLCSEHHDAKSAQQGVDARARMKSARRRPPERHPGLR